MIGFYLRFMSNDELLVLTFTLMSERSPGPLETGTRVWVCGPNKGGRDFVSFLHLPVFCLGMKWEENLDNATSLTWGSQEAVGGMGLRRPPLPPPASSRFPSTGSLRSTQLCKARPWWGGVTHSETKER